MFFSKFIIRNSFLVFIGLAQCGLISAQAPKSKLEQIKLAELIRNSTNIDYNSIGVIAKYVGWDILFKQTDLSKYLTNQKISAADWSPDCSKIAILARTVNDETQNIYIYNTAHNSFELFDSFPNDKIRIHINFIKFLNSDSLLVADCSRVYLLNLKNKVEQCFICEVRANEIEKIGLTAENNLVILFQDNLVGVHLIKIWNTDSGELIKQITVDKYADFCEKDNTVVSATKIPNPLLPKVSSHLIVKLGNLLEGLNKETYRLPSSLFKDYRFKLLNNKKLLIHDDFDKVKNCEICLFDCENKRASVLLSSFDLPGYYPGEDKTIAFSSDGKYVAGGLYGNLKDLESRLGNIIRLFEISNKKANKILEIVMPIREVEMPLHGTDALAKIRIGNDLAALKFSPCDKFLVVLIDNILKIYPNFEKLLSEKF